MSTAILAARHYVEMRPARSLSIAVIAILLVSSVMLAVQALHTTPAFSTWSVLAQGSFASLLAGSASVLGALPILLFKNISERVRDSMLGFGAGVMLAAACFSLILPGIDAAQALTGSKAMAALIVAVGIAAGAGMMVWSHQHIPHEHFAHGPEGISGSKLKQIWLFVGAITLHNFPEGLAVGVSFGQGNSAEGTMLALGIGLQNMPEGLVVALALLAAGYSHRRALGVALLSGLVEPVGGAFGAGVVSMAAPMLPLALAFAAGAMLFVVSHEIIPESHQNGYKSHATTGVLGGFIIMMILDIALG